MAVKPRHNWLDEGGHAMLESDLKIQHCELCSAMRQQIVKNTTWTTRDGVVIRGRTRIVWGYATGDARKFVLSKKVYPCTGRRVMSEGSPSQ